MDSKETSYITSIKTGSPESLAELLKKDLKKGNNPAINMNIDKHHLADYGNLHSDTTGNTTLLHLAVRFNKVEHACLLIVAGAKINALGANPYKPQQEMTPMDTIIERSFPFGSENYQSMLHQSASKHLNMYTLINNSGSTVNNFKNSERATNAEMLSRKAEDPAKPGPFGNIIPVYTTNAEKEAWIDTLINVSTLGHNNEGVLRDLKTRMIHYLEPTITETTKPATEYLRKNQNLSGFVDFVEEQNNKKAKNQPNQQNLAEKELSKKATKKENCRIM